MLDTILQITHLVTGVVTLLPIGLEAAQKIKALLEVDPNYKVSIKQLTDAAITADNEAIEAIEAADPEIIPSPLNDVPTSGA